MELIRLEHPLGRAPFRMQDPELLQTYSMLRRVGVEPGVQVSWVHGEEKILDKDRPSILFQSAPDGKAAHVLEKHQTIPGDAIGKPVGTQYQAPMLLWRRLRRQRLGAPLGCTLDAPRVSQPPRQASHL